MKLEKVSQDQKLSSSELYEVIDISLENINEPSINFINFIRENNSYSFINRFTMEEFTKFLGVLHSLK